MFNKLKFLIKEVNDTIISLIIFIIFLPPMILISFIIKLDSNGPILFTQKRIGKNLKKFNIYKFRTMTHSEENTNESVMHLNEATGPVFKIKNDPRLTKVGKFLRRYSLDELPQLINIFSRDMNLVGPRPLPDYEVEKMEETFSKQRHNIRPGITGLWQVSEREKISSFKNWIKLDLQYINNWSFTMDFKIILKTIGIVIGGRGH
jgi:lipopolysaccharide/colanic/teichoic acid biosynthesis glycosyltransferase